MLTVPLLTNMINTEKLISSLELTVDKSFSWFEFNCLKANASKCRFFLSTYQHISININGSLRITIDSDFTFEEHISSEVPII